MKLAFAILFTLACLAQTYPPEPETHTWARVGDTVLSITNGYAVTRVSTTFPELFRVKEGHDVQDDGNMLIEFTKTLSDNSRDVWLFYFNCSAAGLKTNEQYNVFHRVHLAGGNSNERVAASDDKQHDSVFMVYQTQFELYYSEELVSTNAHLTAMAVDFPEGQVRYNSTIPQHQPYPGWTPK